MKNALKYLAMAALVFFAASCDKDPNGDKPNTGNALVISVENGVIQNNGTDVAKITVTYENEDVTAESEFFDGTQPISIPNGEFKSTEVKTFEIWASYGANTSAKIKINVVPFAVPAPAVDEEPTLTDFYPGLLFMQFTGSECPNCPLMNKKVDPLFDPENKQFSGKQYWENVVRVFSHTYNINSDPASGTKVFGEKFGINGWPTAILDFDYTHHITNLVTSEYLSKMFDEALAAKEGKCPGIAVHSELKDGVLIANASVKAAVDKDYLIGAILLEDGINGVQAGGGKTVFDSCVRLVDGGATKTDIYGHELGHISKGKSMNHVFVWNLKEEWENNKYSSWEGNGFVEKNLRVAYYVLSCKNNGHSKEYTFETAIAATANANQSFIYAAE